LVCREDCNYRCYRDLGTQCVPDASLEPDGAASADGMSSMADSFSVPDALRFPDATPGLCPNGNCDPGECTSCPSDCMTPPGMYMCCMNAVCDPPTDCVIGCTSACTAGECLAGYCGDLYCDPGENCVNCYDDCGTCSCNGDPVCNMPPENCINCPQQCTACAF
jgi:hypothetical protein